MNAIILAILSGSLLIFSQLPFKLGSLGWFALVPLFLALQGKNLKKSFLYGFIAGAVYFSGILYWILPLRMPITIFATIILVAYLALSFGLFSLCFNFLSVKFKQSALNYVFFAAILWVSIEYLRTLGPLGFPWGFIAYSQWQNLMLIQISDITGVYGVSFVLILFNAALAWIIYQYRKPFDVKRLATASAMWMSLILISVLIFVFFYGMKNVAKYTSVVSDKANEVDVALVQGNIDQDKKWDSSYLSQSLGTYINITREMRTFPDLIVWPETAITLSLNENESLRVLAKNFTKTCGTYFLTGVDETEKGKYYNRAVLFSPDGEIAGSYDKIHLVPFGEQTPYILKIIFPFLKTMIKGEDFVSGKERTVFVHPKTKFGVNVCFESIFPDETRQYAKNGSEILINLTNDAWFGRTCAPYQHFSINVFRAVENRMEIARAANSGISGFVNKLGQPQFTTKIYTQNLSRTFMKLRNETTFYTRFGDIFSIVCLISFLILLVIPALKRK